MLTRIPKHPYWTNTETEAFYVQVGTRMYSVFAETASHAVTEALAAFGDPDTWPGECLVWNTAYYRREYGEPAELIQL